MGKKDDEKIADALKREADRNDNGDGKNYTDEEALKEIQRRTGKK